MSTETEQQILRQLSELNSRVGRVEHAILGNGTKGLADRVTSVEDEVKGVVGWKKAVPFGLLVLFVQAVGALAVVLRAGG